MNFIQDMTKGSPLKLILTFSLPMLMGNLFQQLYTMADSIIVGRFVGADALAAIGACGSTIYLFFSLFLGLSAGIGIVVSQYFGAGKGTEVRQAIAGSVYLLAISSAVMTVLGIVLARPVLLLLGTPEAILHDATLYFQITSAGMAAIAFYNGIASVLRALGDSKTPLIFLVAAALLNIGLDLLFVPVFHWGVSGAALATILAQFVSACSCLIFSLRTNPYFRFTKADFSWNGPLLKQMAYVGLPLALQNAMIAFSCVLLQGVINSFGTKIVAAFTATNRIENLVVQIYVSLHTALSSYTAQNLGAGDVHRVRAGTRCAIGITAAFAFLMMLVMYLFGETFVGWFVQDNEVISIGASALKLVSWFFLFWGLLHIYRAVLNGAGIAGFAFVSGILEVVGRGGAAVILTAIPAIGYWGIWAAEGVTWILITLAGLLCYLQRAWTRKNLIQDPQEIRELSSSLSQAHTDGIY